MSAPSIHSYDLERFDFPATVAEILDAGPLRWLRGADGAGVVTREMDQSTAYHVTFYKNFDALRSLYVDFVDQVVASLIEESFCFQSIPTFRVHLPNNLAVGEFHNDGDYGHRVGEINFWVPLTPAWGTNTLWLEKGMGTKEYAPVELEPGQFLMFDAIRLSHGNRINQTGQSRVSFDFRCIPLSKYEESDECSVNTGRRLIIGDYFEIFSGKPGAHSAATPK